MNNNLHGYDREKDTKAPASMRIWFGIFMVIFYIGIGVLLIVANQTFQILTPVISIVIGAILCLYGIFRGYRLWKGEP